MPTLIPNSIKIRKVHILVWTTLTLYCSVTVSWCNVGQEVCVTPAATATQPVIWSRLLCACERHLQDEDSGGGGEQVLEQVLGAPEAGHDLRRDAHTLSQALQCVTAVWGV